MPRISPKVAGTFIANTANTVNFGFTKSAYWFSFTLVAAKDAPFERLLEIAFPMLDDVQLFFHSNLRPPRQVQLGDHLPFAERPVEHRNFLVPLELAPGEEMTVLMRVKTTSAMRVPVALWDTREFIGDGAIHANIQGLFLGLVLVMAIYNLFVFVSLRQWVYLYYVVFTLGVLGFQSGVHGLSFQYLFPEHPWWSQKVLLLAVAAGAMGGTRFTSQFLGLRNHARRHHFVFRALFGLAVAMLPLTFILHYSTLCHIHAVFVLVGTVACLSAGVLSLRQGNVEARYYVAAWLCFLFGACWLAFANQGWLVANLWTVHAIDGGLASLVVLLSFGLSKKLRSLNEENLRIRMEATELQHALRQLKESQAQLVQASKLSSLGQLGMGIAHELNQPLTGICGLCELMLEEPASLSPPIGENIVIIQEQAHRMADIVANVRSFGRETKGEFSVMPLCEPVDKALGLLGVQLSTHGISVIKSKWDSSLSIVGDPLVLQQVMINLLGNAKDALLELPAGRPKKIKLSIFRKEHQALFKIEDSGPGIDSRAGERLFDPFFTTKEVGEGTGLGLSISLGIVEKHGGSIEVVNSSLAGAAFEIRFPITQANPQDTKSPARDSAPPQAYSFAGLRVLVVEDDSVVRQVVGALVARTGCSVTCLPSAAAALEKLAAESFDLILTDFAMPDMCGDELIKNIRERGCHTPAVLMSGALTPRARELALEAGAMLCLEKPVDSRTITQVLNDLLADS